MEHEIGEENELLYAKSLDAAYLPHDFVQMLLQSNVVTVNVWFLTMKMSAINAANYTGRLAHVFLWQTKIRLWINSEWHAIRQFATALRLIQLGLCIEFTPRKRDSGARCRVSR